MTANFLTFHDASLFPHLVIDLFIWLPQNYGTIFPLLLEITSVKGAVSRSSAKLGNYKMPVKLRETQK